MKTMKHLRRIGLIFALAGLVGAPLSARADDPMDIVLQWMGLGTTTSPTPPPPSAPDGGPGGCPTSGGC